MKLLFKYEDGSSKEFLMLPGGSLMEAAIANSIPGIIAECRGSCTCATCHVYIDPEWVSRIPDPEELEEDLLDSLSERTVNSRLSCQVMLTEALDGMSVTVPSSQY